MPRSGPSPACTRKRGGARPISRALKPVRGVDPLASVPVLRAARVRGVLDAVPRGRPVLAGVSGGRDSVFLLRLRVWAGFRKITVCHLDHGLRGAASRGDAVFVRRLARTLGCGFAGGRRVVRARAGVSLEAAGRAARHAFFARVARRIGARRIFLGHHADDRVETFLFHLMRGSGGRGLSSLRTRTTLRMDGVRMEVVRPLLALFREDVDRAMAAGDWEWREDATNGGRGASRNRIRHDLLPAIEQVLERPVREAIWRAAEVLGAESDWIDGQIPRLSAWMDARALAALPVALQRRWVGGWLRRHAVPAAGFDEIEAVRALALAVRPARAQLGGGILAARRAGRIRIERPAKRVCKPVVSRKCRSPGPAADR